MTYRQRKSRRRKRPSIKGKLVLGLGVIATVVAIGILSVAGYVFAIASTAPELSELKPVDKGQVSVVFAADGTRLGFVQSDILRRVVPFTDMPPEMRQATVAIEDERFYKHEGVDLNAILRAGIKNLESGKTVQGGSTITQQLVRALYIRDPKRDFARKIREAKLASELEEKHSKRWILHEYLNSVPYGTVGGRTAIGVQAAAVTFFDKNVDDLTLDESALLAGLPQAPSQYNPFRNKGAALARRNEVLRAMRDNDYITQSEYLDAIRQPVKLKRGTRYITRREPYFFDYVQEQLIEKYGVGVVRKGGLKVYTTIDPQLQLYARDAINAYYADPAGPASAIVALDPSNGKIRAMASSGSYDSRNFNLAAQGHRQPGSAFKTFVLTAAVRRGIDPDATSYTSKPLAINDPKYGRWDVKTFGNTYLGTVSLTRATLSSDNSVYAQLILDVGPKAVCKTAKLLGITTKLDCYPAEGLGGLTRGVTTLEMASAYATLANGGIRHRPTGIQKVVFPDGKSENLAKRGGKRVLTDGQAAEVTRILEMNVQSGTGTAADFGCPAAGKTGTTDEAKDAWFVGFTPKISAAVWVGYPDAGVAMPGAQGGTYAAPVWHAFMEPAHGDFCDGFPSPQQPFQASPFFGDYASTGSSTTSSGYSYGGSTSTPSTGTNGYNPQYYESPPQPAPDVQAPPEQVAPAPAPAPGNGNGVGNGGVSPGQQ
jgi:penicillin-binding protein 1A